MRKISVIANTKKAFVFILFKRQRRFNVQFLR